MSDENIGQLLPISQAQVGDAPIQTVDGRALHAFLGVGRDFTNWMKDRIAKYSFEEGRDYITVSRSPNLASGNRGAGTDYHLSLDMAKEIAMVENNDQGRRARRYFIECERLAKGGAPVTPVMTEEEIMARALLISGRRIEELKKAVAELAPKADALDRIATADGSLSVTDAAKALQVRPKDLFAYLQAHSWIYRRAGSEHFVGYQGRVQTGDLEHKVTTVLRADGSEKMTEQVRVTAKGLAKLAKLMAPAAQAVA